MGTSGQVQHVPKHLPLYLICQPPASLNNILLAMERWVCPPWYECRCRTWKPESLSTMHRHRKDDNNRRNMKNRGPFRWNPKVRVPYVFFQDSSYCIRNLCYFANDSLDDHDTDDDMANREPLECQPSCTNRMQTNQLQRGILNDDNCFQPVKVGSHNSGERLDSCSTHHSRESMDNRENEEEFEQHEDDNDITMSQIIRTDTSYRFVTFQQLLMTVGSSGYSRQATQKKVCSSARLQAVSKGNI